MGARRDGVMRFRARLPQDTATLLLSASFVIVLVALAVASHGEASRHVDTLSADAAVCLLAIYGAGAVVVPALRRAARGRPRGVALIAMYVTLAAFAWLD